MPILEDAEDGFSAWQDEVDYSHIKLEYANH